MKYNILIYFEFTQKHQYVSILIITQPVIFRTSTLEKSPYFQK